MTTAFVTTRHRCDHCRRSYASVTAARKHEADCYRNPDAKACPTCAHHSPTEWVDCAVGVAEYSNPSRHPDDDPLHVWTKNCPAWTPKENA